jgi:hypothetical protein
LHIMNSFLVIITQPCNLQHNGKGFTQNLSYTAAYPS